MLIHFPIIPAVSFIAYDMADVPVLIGTLLYGPIPGLLILLVASLVQAFIQMCIRDRFPDDRGP